MKKEIVQLVSGIYRVTTLDERFYGKEGKDALTGLPTVIWRRSITYIAHFCYKGKEWDNWLKKNGEEADAIRDARGERGSKIHQAIEVLNNGGEVKFNDKFTSNITGELEELTPDEYNCVMDYQRWWIAEGSKQYRILAAEQTIWPEDVMHDKKPLEFAATLDILVERIADGKKGVIDLKTSKAIYDSHIVQVSAIGEAVGADFQAILQIGYTPNKCRYKFTEIARRMDLYWLAWATCMREAEKHGDQPLQRDFPVVLSLGLAKTVSELKKEISDVEAEIASLEKDLGEPMPEELAAAQPNVTEPPEGPKVVKTKTHRQHA